MLYDDEELKEAEYKGRKVKLNKPKRGGGKAYVYVNSGKKDKKGRIWLFGGTGDYDRINDTTPGVSNYLLGIKDPHYPYYRDVAVPTKADDITKCKNTTNDTNGVHFPKTADKGWYAILPNFAKTTAEPTAKSGNVFFPVYEPTTGLNRCFLGDAYICARDGVCGTDVSRRSLGKSSGNKSMQNCLFVGSGVLSKIVFFGIMSPVISSAP